MEFVPDSGGPAKVGVVYLGGFDGIPPRPGGIFRQSWHWGWHVLFSMDGVAVFVKENKTLSPTVRVASQGWDGLLGVFFETAHSSVNPLALAVFGLLGLGARTDNMVMDIRFTQEAEFVTPQASAEPHAAFLVNWHAYDVRLAAEAIERAIPSAHGKFGMLSDLDQVTASGSGPEQISEPSLADELDRIARLHERGLLSDEEFANAKRHILESD